MSLTRSYTISGGSNNTIYYSDNLGATWTLLTQTGIPTYPNVVCLAVNPTNPLVVLVGLSVNGGIYKSIDGGDNFTLIPSTVGSSYFNIKFIDSERVIAVGPVVSLSSDSGDTFVTYPSTAAIVYGSGAPVNAKFDHLFVETPSDIYAAIFDKVFKSTNGGIDWVPLNNNLPFSPGAIVEGISSNSQFVNVAVTEIGVMHSNNYGNTFSATLSTTLKCVTSQLNQSVIFAFTSSDSTLWRSVDNGVNWTVLSSNIGSGSSAGAIVVYAYSLNDIILISQFEDYNPTSYTILYTGDGGANFTVAQTNVIRIQAYGTADLFECSECPSKYTLNPVSNLCENNIQGVELLCDIGYVYDTLSPTPRCVSESDPLDFYEIQGCPSYCEVVTSADPRGYCNCLSQLDVFPCCYQLNDCKGVATPIITQTNLLTYFENESIIKIQGSDVCWEIEKLDEICEIFQNVIVTDVLASCLVCDPSYSLHNCKDDKAVIYTTQDISDSLGKIVKVAEYPNECWIVKTNDTASFTPEVVTIEEEFNFCEECNPTIYQLNNCFNSSSFILTDQELKAVMGKTISVVGYPGLCFTITEPSCKCLTVQLVINGIPSETNATSSENLINGKHYYVFGIGSSNYYLVWNITLLRWELYNSDTSTLIAYSPLNIDCIYTDFWVILEDVDSVVTKSCSGVLYDITVDKEYNNCECCTSKNCK